ncbi:Cytochrome b5 reductase with F-box domain, partial [Phytophthora palmivora]
MVQVVKRQGYKLLNLWTTDKATFPVVFCASFAAVAATGMSLRYLFQNPDVYVNKDERFTELHHTLEPREDRGSAWRQFRFRMANLKRNPINQSRQFDDLFAKEENKSWRRLCVSWRGGPSGLRRFCTADEDKYLELKQLKDIKSEEFYDNQAQKRRYFYYVDLQGRLFLEDTRPKNIATSLKSAKFLRFFFSQVRLNGIAQCKLKEEEEFLEYPYRSPCGKEMNFIKCADRPFVFEDLRRGESGKWMLVFGVIINFSNMTSGSNTAVSTGNRVAQFIVITAVMSVLYQLFTRPSVSPPSSLGSGYRKGEDSRRFTSSEITGFLLFLGLFGLLQHKKKQDKKADIEAEQKQIARIAQIQRNSLRNGVSKAPLVNLPCDVLHELLLFLSPKDLATCPVVCRALELSVGDAAETLWRRVFQRDFGEPGDRFGRVFPIECWRQFYFRHHLSRAVEIARLLDITDDRKCVAIEGQVYDITDFLDLHPGGPHVIGDAVGTDATVIWDQFRHSEEAKESMQQFL